LAFVFFQIKSLLVFSIQNKKILQSLVKKPLARPSLSLRSSEAISEQVGDCDPTLAMTEIE